MFGILFVLNSTASACGTECQIRADCAPPRFDPPEDPAPRLPVIQCGNESNPLLVRLEQPFDEMPAEGQVPASFSNVGMPLHDYVTTSISQKLGTRVIDFETAYCQYRIQIGSADFDRYFVVKALNECEGQKTDLDCRIL